MATFERTDKTTKRGMLDRGNWVTTDKYKRETTDSGTQTTQESKTEYVPDED